MVVVVAVDEMHEGKDDTVALTLAVYLLRAFVALAATSTGAFTMVAGGVAGVVIMAVVFGGML